MLNMRDFICSKSGMLLIFLVVIIVPIIEVWILTRPTQLRIRGLRIQVHLLHNFLIFICSLYVWKRLSVFVHTKNLRALLKFMILILSLIAQVGIVCILYFIQAEPFLLSYLASFCAGSIIHLSFCMVVADICSFMCRRIICRKNRVFNSLDKTEVKIRFLLSLVIAMILTISGTICANNLIIERVVVPIKGLDLHLNGTTIVQVSDVHLGPFNGRLKLTSIIQKVNKLQGDIVVITGDLVDSSVDSLWEAVMPLKKIQSKYGVYYITGNHEYYTGDVDNWITSLPKLNVTPLINRRVCLLSPKHSCERGLYLAGLEDWETRIFRYGAHSMDIHSALSGRTPGIPTVVLAHQPKAAAEAIMWDNVKLVLSGHTHAGQILPLMFLTYLYNPFFVGLYQPHPGVYVYVNPGTVYYYLPFRHYSPEITLMTLSSK